MDIPPTDDAPPKKTLSTSLLPIVIHQHPKCIQVGKYYACFPDLYLLPEVSTHRKDAILRANSIDWATHTFGNTHELRKVYCHYLGTKFNQRFQRISYALWIGNNETLIHRFCHRGKKLCNELVYRFHYFQSLIQQALDNNEQHLIPLLLFFGVDVNTMKAGLGAALWKYLCKNSFSRNHAIFSCAAFIAPLKSHDAVSPQFHKLQTPDIKPYSLELAKPVLEQIIHLPTSLLKLPYFHRAINHPDEHPDFYDNENDCVMNGVEAHQEILQIFQRITRFGRERKKLSDRQFIRNTHQLINDTYRMAKQLEQPVNDNWSLTRLEREHKALIKKYNAIVYAHYHEPYEFLLPWVKTIHYHNIIATLLESRYALVMEGKEMDHCVASYHYDVRIGHSIIFSLQDQHDYRSTLQLIIQGTDITHKKLHINQHKSRHNDDVCNPDFIDAAHHILEIQQSVADNENNYRKMDE